MDWESFNDSEKPDVLKKMFVSLCFLHAVLTERKKYGPLGWNVQYMFNIADLNISIKQCFLILAQEGDI